VAEPGASVSLAAASRCCCDQLSRNARVSLMALASDGGEVDTAAGSKLCAAFV
jgi:hypothetical protein